MCGGHTHPFIRDLDGGFAEPGAAAASAAEVAKMSATSSNTATAAAGQQRSDSQKGH